jgi:hypothetical protein
MPQWLIVKEAYASTVPQLERPAGRGLQKNVET